MVQEIKLNVIGNGHFTGSATNLTQYSVTEDSTPTDAGDSSGGVGSMDFGVVEDPASDGTILLLNDIVELTDGSNGKTTGTVKSVSSNDGQATASADSRLGQLIAEKQVQPFTGTLGGAFTYYLSVAGISAGIVIDPSIVNRDVVFPGFYGDLWDNMKQMCAAEDIELSLVSNNIVLRPLRTRVVDTKKWSSISWTVQNSDLARNVEVYAYNSRRIVNGLVYPKGGWNPDVQVYQVDASQTLQVEIPVDVSIESLVQPTVAFNVDRYFSTGSVYAVAGNDGLPITPAQWTSTGGSVKLSIGEDTKTILVTITGSSLTAYAPYRIAVSSGPSDSYSSLRIIGTGVHFDKQLLTVPTGAPFSKTAVDVGVTIDNPFITSTLDAYAAALKAAGRFAAPAQTINLTATVLNRKGEQGSTTYPTFGQFNTINAGKTFAQFDTTSAGKTFGDFTADYFALVADAFENQAFGNIAGARVKFRDAWYRIRNATITQDNITVNAERDTIFSDHNTANAGKTFGDFNTRWSGKTFGDYAVIPLWT